MRCRMKKMNLEVFDFLVGDIVISLKDEPYLITGINYCTCDCHKGNEKQRLVSVDVLFIKTGKPQTFSYRDYQEGSTRKVYRF